MKKILLILMIIPSLIILVLWSFGYLLYTPLNSPILVVIVPIITIVIIYIKSKGVSVKYMVFFTILMITTSILYFDQRLGASLKEYQVQNLEAKYEGGELVYREYYCEEPKLWSQSRAGFGLFDRETDLYRETPLSFLKTRNKVTEYLQGQEICTESS